MCSGVEEETLMFKEVFMCLYNEASVRPQLLKTSYQMFASSGKCKYL